MKLLKVMKLVNDNKKYEATFLLDTGKEKKVKFGASGYRDFTLINDKNSKFYLPKTLDRNVVKDSYLRRHEKNENWNSPTTPGALSRWLLWNKKTFNSSLKDYKKRFKL